MLVFDRTRNPFLSSAWIARSSFIPAEGDDNGLNSGDQNEDHIRGRIEEAYHDDPSQQIEGQAEGQAASLQVEDRDKSGSGGRGPIVQPSRLQNEGNEWRES